MPRKQEKLSEELRTLLIKIGEVESSNGYRRLEVEDREEVTCLEKKLSELYQLRTVDCYMPTQNSTEKITAYEVRLSSLGEILFKAEKAYQEFCENF